MATFNTSSSVLPCLEREREYINRHRLLDRESQFVQLQREILAEHADEKDFRRWDSRRARLMEFDYLFLHRKNLSEQQREWLEIIAAKITYVTRRNQPGYFANADRHARWREHITPLAMADVPGADSLVRCGLWASRRNSRRCQNVDLCPLCLWHKKLRVLSEAYAADTLTFHRAPAWHFITCAFTDDPAHSKPVGKTLEQDDYETVRNDPANAYPVVLDSGIPWAGYDDCRLLGRIMQDAMDALYRDCLHGYHNKLEGAFRIRPGSYNACNFHCHAVANSTDHNPQYVADFLFDQMQAGLKKREDQLMAKYHPDVLVHHIATPEDLERVIQYTEKVVPIALIVDEAKARCADSPTMDRDLAGLREALKDLVETLEHVFSGYQLDSWVRGLLRRKTVGNMRFGKNCVAEEPAWHRIQRETKSRKQREKRQQRRAQEG